MTGEDPLLVTGFAGDAAAAALLDRLDVPASPLAEASVRLGRGERPDAVVIALDLSQPRQSAALRAIVAAMPESAVVVIDRSGDRDLALTCVAEGAQDCLEAEGLSEGVLMRAVRHAIARGRRRQTAADEMTAAREELHRLGTSLADAQRIANLGAWDWHIESGRLWWSDEIYRIFGVEPGSFAATYEAFLSYIHPEDRPALEDTVTRAVMQIRPYDLQHRILRPDGSERVVHQRGDVVLGPDRRPERLVGSMHDVTERAQAELLLRAARDELEERVQDRTRELRAEVAQRKRAEQVSKLNEARLRMVADAMPALIGYLDADERFQFANARYRDWFGVFPEEALGQPLEAVVGASFYKVLQPSIERVLQGRDVTHEGWVTLRSGRMRFYLATFMPHRGPDEQVLGFFSLIQDITERKRTEEALRRSENKYRALLNDAADAIVLVGLDGSMLEANRQAEILLGRSEESLRGSHLLHLFPDPAAHAAIDAALIDLAELGYASVNDVELTLTDRTLPLDVSASAVEFNGERFFQAILKDVSGHKAAEEQLRAAKEAAELADRAKSDFLANMSHELRTPLNAIIGFSDIMRHELMGPVGSVAYVGYIKDIHDSGRHLLEVINEVLDMSKIESGNLELHTERVDLPDLVAACCRLVSERASTGKLALKVELPDRLPQVEVDERRLKQVLLNLLSNAVKFTPPGGAVTVLAERRGDGGLALAVRDTGIGMSADDLAKALAPFGQVDSSLARKYEGTGLGLPLAKSFVELHGGALDVDSAPGQGTTVWAILPPARVVAEDQPAVLVG